MEQYQDIMNSPRYVSVGRARMTVLDRAAQFSAFAALTGFDGVIRESERLTEPCAELDEGVKAALNEMLCQLIQEQAEQPSVTLTWFQPDKRKAGGAYVHVTGKLKKVDTYDRELILTDGTRIPIDSLYAIKRKKSGY